MPLPSPLLAPDSETITPCSNKISYPTDNEQQVVALAYAYFVAHNHPMGPKCESCLGRQLFSSLIDIVRMAPWPIVFAGLFTGILASTAIGVCIPWLSSPIPQDLRQRLRPFTKCSANHDVLATILFYNRIRNINSTQVSF
jgi:hypothetical protein